MKSSCWTTAATTAVTTSKTFPSFPLRVVTVLAILLPFLGEAFLFPTTFDIIHSIQYHHLRPILGGQGRYYQRAFSIVPSGRCFSRQDRRLDTMIRRTSSLARDDDDCPENRNMVDKALERRIRLQQEQLGSPRFSFGVLADIQYAPIPDGYSYSGSPRYYKHALDVARHAAEHFEKQKVDIVLNLGDTVDGKCQNIALNGGDPVPDGVDPGRKCVDDVMQALSAFTQGPIIHSYGNHCLYNLDRQTMSEIMGMPFVKEPCGDLVGYHSHVHKGIRFVVLDSYDVAILRRCEQTSQKRKAAMTMLTRNNPNEQQGYNSPNGLVGNERRFVGFNGAVGGLQLQWLREALSEARESCEKVILLSHQPILPESSNPVCIMWNYDEVLTVLRDFSDVVIASFSGHAHEGGYCRDEKSGIHFRVFEATLESYPEKTYAMVDVHDGCISIRGFGDCASAIYNFEHMTINQDEDTSPAGDDVEALVE